MDEPIASLRFNGNRYGLWQSVEIQMSVDDICAAVRLAIVGAGQGESLGLDVNTVADLLIGDTLVTTVRPDSVRRKVSGDRHGIAIEARSLGRELVDCQYSKTLSGLTLGEIVTRLCATFKVPVKIAAKTEAVPQFSMQCELPSNALINAVRAANLLLYPLPTGGLILTAPTDDPPVTTLEYGVNIAEYTIVDEFKLRFSEYVVKSFDYAADAPRRGAAKDDAFNFFRPMHIVADRYSHGIGGCERRALLERNRRQARAHRIELEVNEWRYVDGAGNPVPWQLNTQVRVIIPEEGIDEVLLIGDIGFSSDTRGGPGSGERAKLTVMPRNAFIGEPKKKSKRGAGVKKGAN